jgi:hypothetical protein
MFKASLFVVVLNRNTNTVAVVVPSATAVALGAPDVEAMAGLKWCCSQNISCAAES